MSGIVIFASIVRCTHSLLICEDIDTDHWRFTDMGACTSALETLVRDAELRYGDAHTVMGRCHYVVPRQRAADFSPQRP